MRKINGAGRIHSIISVSLLLGTAEVLENDPKIRYLSFEDHYIFIHLLKEKMVSEKMIKKRKR